MGATWASTAMSSSATARCRRIPGLSLARPAGVQVGSAPASEPGRSRPVDGLGASTDLSFRISLAAVRTTPLGRRFRHLMPSGPSDTSVGFRWCLAASCAGKGAGGVSGIGSADSGHVCTKSPPGPVWTKGGLFMFYRLPFWPRQGRCPPAEPPSNWRPWRLAKPCVGSSNPALAKAAQRWLAFVWLSC